MRARLAMISAALCLAVAGEAAFTSGAVAAQIDSASFFGLRRGMTESEILLRAGPPDLVTSGGLARVEVVTGAAVPAPDGSLTIGTVRRVIEPVLERWHYIPDRSEHDPHLTIISFKGGLVWDLRREKVFSRAHLPEAPEVAEGPSGEAPPSDHDLRVKRAERTLEAAEAYASTRERLRRSAEATGEPGTRPEIHRGTDSSGAVFYGDAPPPLRPAAE